MPEIIEVLLFTAAMFGITVGCKLMIWGRGPIWKGRRKIESTDVETRFQELEERLELQAFEIEERYASRVVDLEERLDFAERMLSQPRFRAIEAPEPNREPTPV